MRFFLVSYNKEMNKEYVLFMEKTHYQTRRLQ